jgi:hypothetical protein
MWGTSFRLHWAETSGDRPHRLDLVGRRQRLQEQVTCR